MKIKRFFAKDIRAALDEIKVTLGPDAIIMSNKNVEGGVEIVAAIDEDNNAVVNKSPQQPIKEAAPEPESPAQPNENSWDTTSRFEGEFNDDQVSLSGFQQRLIKQQAQNAVSEFTPSSSLASETADTTSFSTPSEELPAWAQSLSEPQPSPSLNNQAQGLDLLGQATESPVIEELRQEMASMRQLLQHQVSSLMTQDASRRDPVRHLMSNELVRLGFDNNVAQQLMVNVPANSDIEQAKTLLANTMLERISSTRNDVLEQGGVVALLGPTGVGKTTTVAKLAARYAMRFGQDNVAMITTDSYRIGAYEQLNTYGKIMGCPVTVAKDAQQLADAIYQYRTKRLVLIDTAGMGQRDIRLNEQLTTLMNSSHVAIRSYLVLPATAQRQVLEDAITQFRKIPLTGAIVTKMDEAISASEILSVAIGNALPIGYLTNGQRVPEDIGVADIKKLIDSVVEHIGNDVADDTQDIARFNR
ncbi:MAG: flagellar biosynthesis protein FlhF [Psychrobium sp.]